MATISARGCHALARWVKGDARLVLRSDGALLGAYLRVDSLTVHRKMQGANRKTPAQLIAAAQRYADRLGYTRAPDR